MTPTRKDFANFELVTYEANPDPSVSTQQAGIIEGVVVDRFPFTSAIDMVKKFSDRVVPLLQSMEVLTIDTQAETLQILINKLVELNAMPYTGSSRTNVSIDWVEHERDSGLFILSPLWSVINREDI